MRGIGIVCALGALALLAPSSGAAEPSPLESIELSVATLPGFPALAARDHGFAVRYSATPAGFIAETPRLTREGEGWNSLACAISTRLERAGVTSAPIVSLDPLERHVDLQMTLGFEHNVERLTVKSIKRFVLDSVGFTRNVDAMENRVLDQNGVPRKGSVGQTRYRFSVSHLIPRMTMSRPVGEGSMSFSVNALGVIGVGLSPTRSQRTRFFGGYDRPRDTYDFYCAVRF